MFMVCLIYIEACNDVILSAVSLIGDLRVGCISSMIELLKLILRFFLKGCLVNIPKALVFFCEI